MLTAIVKEPRAIPIIASLVGVKLRSEMSLTRMMEIKIEKPIAPMKIRGSCVVIRPAALHARKMAAAPQIPKRLGSPKGLLDDS